MSLAEGSRFGPYEVTGTIGAGGMGEVYRARDSKLGRAVALKILPPAFATDPDRVARFEREARTLAALNHPHIAQVYGFEQSASGSALVMELVEGEDLAARLARGPIPAAEAIPIAKQIALALEAAHDLGIIHRDLKPANIKLRPDGTVKVLDFGLAKALDDGSAAAGAHDELNSPTITSPAAMTVHGIVLGTAAYMSPEQARGKTVDRRADIWAFGVVLYEMLTGTQAFAGETVSDTIAAVLTREPDPGRLPLGTSASVRYTLERCLDKDPARRFHHIADARLELERHTTERASIGSTPVGRRHSWRALAALAILAAAAIPAAWWMGGRRTPATPRYSFTIPDAGFSTVSFTAVSPDGRWIAYAPNVHSAPFRLFLRSLDSFQPREVTSSSDTFFSPFFSPDGQWLAFFSGGHLYRVRVDGGMPERLAQVSRGQSEGDWGVDGTIVVSGDHFRDGAVRRTILRLDAKAGTLEPITTDAPNEEHRDPHVLPDGRTVLFTRLTAIPEIAAVSIGGGEIKTILTDAHRPRYSSEGYLLFRRPSSGDLMAAAFDPSALELVGDPIRVDAVAQVAASAAFDVSQQGTLIYSAPGDTAEQSGFTVVAVDASGSETPLLAQPGNWATPRVSPDGRLLAFREISSPNCVLWTFDIVRGIPTRLVYAGDNHDPVWRGSGELSWSTETQEARGIRVGRIDRAAQVASMAQSPDVRRLPESWSPDDSLLAITETNPKTGDDILLVSIGSGQARPFAATPAREGQARFSRDGRWIAYVTDESGNSEVYLQELDAGGERLQLSAAGGHSPLWSKDGRQLFFVEGTRVMVVDVDLQKQPAGASRPRKLLEGPYVLERSGNFDVMADGRLVLVRRPLSEDPSATLRVLVNWHPPIGARSR